jgi:A/G-specific adenine glycosylase
MLHSSALEIRQVSKEYRQQLTHQTIIGQFITVSLNGLSEQLEGYKKVHGDELKRYPFPRFITAYLDEAPFA